MIDVEKEIYKCRDSKSFEEGVERFEKLVRKMEQERKKIFEAATSYALCKDTGSSKSEHEAYVKLMDLMGVTDYWENKS